MFLSQTLILWTKRAYQSGIFKLLSGWMKIHQISYILFKARSQSSLNFASLVRAMIDNSSVLFQLKLYMIWRIWAHQSPKLQTFNCSLKISRNLHFDSRFLLLKVYKILVKKVQRSYVSWSWWLMQNLKKNWSVVSKMTRISENLTGGLKSLNNLEFHWFMLCKVFNVWPKKGTEELSFMKLASDTKFEEKMTCGLENDMRNTANFHQSTWKSQNWDFDGII